MKVTPVVGNSVRLDGGAMFGNAPKALWERWLPADERNRIHTTSRGMLVEHNDRKILFETGIGAFFSPELRDRYGVIESHHVLLDSLRQAGTDERDIDIVVLSHLHFDHAGGLLTAYEKEREPSLLFENATFVVSERAWARAKAPHARDRASFIPGLTNLLEASGRLHLVDGPQSELLGPRFVFHYSEGHTPGLLLTEVATDRGPLLFAGDLVPAVPWVHLPITMGYDRFAEKVIDEKERLLEELLSRNGRLFFTHDLNVAMATLRKTETGKFEVYDFVGDTDATA